MSVHPLGNTALRTKETFARYHNNPKREAEECFVCVAHNLILNAKYWRFIANEFPYDAVASIHLMIAPIRHVGTYEELDEYERDELVQVKRLLDAEGNFDAVIENLTRGRTFMPHYHLHVIQWKRT